MAAPIGQGGGAVLGRILDAGGGVGSSGVSGGGRGGKVGIN